MKLGKDEVGILYLIGAVMLSYSSFCVFYGLFGNLVLTAIGLPFMFFAAIFMRADVLDHRKTQRFNA